MISLQIKTDVSAAVRSTQQDRTAQLQKQAEVSGRKILDLLRSHTPISKEPGGGELRSGWSMQSLLNPNKTTLQFKNTAPDAPLLLNVLRTGSKPHIIRPKKARVLAFSIRNKMTFAKIVHHPGTKPSPLWTGVDAPLEKALAELKSGIKDAYV